VLEVEPQLIEAYVRTGKMRIIVRPLFQTGEDALLSAHASECAGEQQHYFAMRAAIYADQGGLYAAESMTAGLAQRARDIGINGDDFDRCMQSDKYRLLLLTEYTRAKDAGIVSRPVFEINGQRIIGARQFSEFADIIDHLKP
jgi:protein-disulfide isomerase